MYNPKMKNYKEKKIKKEKKERYRKRFPKEKKKCE